MGRRCCCAGHHTPCFLLARVSLHLSRPGTLAVDRLPFQDLLSSRFVAVIRLFHAVLQIRLLGQFLVKRLCLI